jgi:integrase
MQARVRDLTLYVRTPCVSMDKIMTTSFKKILKRAGLTDMTFHAATRHTAATLLFGKGTHPKLVQELLGHATISITLDTYSHVLPGMGDQTATAMDAALS